MCVSYNTCLLVYFLKRDRYVYSYLAKIKRGSRNKTDEQQYTTNSIYNDIGVRFCVLMDAVIVLCVYGTLHTFISLFMLSPNEFKILFLIIFLNVH